MRRTNVTSTSGPIAGLVHGALTGPSVWNDVTRRLQACGHRVLAPVLPMRSLQSDAAYLAGLLDRVEGPIVLVGHSYAGAVISHPAVAASGAVEAVVFIAAFQPDEGKAAGAPSERFPGTLLTPENLDVVPSPLRGNDLTIKPGRFPDVHAADIEPEHAAVMGVSQLSQLSQRPVDPAALGEPLPASPPGGQPRPGRSYRPGTGRCRRRSCVSWPNAPALPSWRSTRRTPHQSRGPALSAT